MPTDVRIENHGTIVVFYPESEAAWDWVEENVDGGMVRYGPAIAVEHRFAEDIATGMINDGLEVV